MSTRRIYSRIAQYTGYNHTKKFKQGMRRYKSAAKLKDLAGDMYRTLLKIEVNTSTPEYMQAWNRHGSGVKSAIFTTKVTAKRIYDAAETMEELYQNGIEAVNDNMPDTATESIYLIIEEVDSIIKDAKNLPE